jgi:hypothetical protein
MASIDWTAKSHSAALHSEGRALEKLVEKIKERIGAAQYQGETSVREAIVLPLLQVLGWDIFDPTIVIREYTLGARRVDYALCSSPPRKDVFIEVKALRQSVGGDRQLFEYAFHEGIPFAILTDGREWNFFVPGEQGTYDERRVQKVDVVERPVTDVMQIFSRYLSFARVKSGEAIESARADYQNISKRKTAANEIPKAWGELVSEPDEVLIDLIAEKAETLCGYRPAPEDVEAFLIGNFKVGVPPPCLRKQYPRSPQGAKRRPQSQSAVLRTKCSVKPSMRTARLTLS